MHRHATPVRLMVVGLALWAGMVCVCPAQAKALVTIAAVGGNPPAMPTVVDHQERVGKVLEYWQEQLGKVLPHRPDLIVLPEACDRPGGMEVPDQLAYFVVRKDQVRDYFAAVAREHRCYIAFGMKHQQPDGSFLNSAFLLDRQGRQAGVYHKNYPTVGEMAAGIRAADAVPIIETEFGRVACAICFDLNFDELRLKVAAARPDIILFLSMYHGGMVQSYWAYTCRAFFVGAMGQLETPCEIRNPLGEVLATSTNYFNYTVARVNLDARLVHLDENWEKLAALKAKYGHDVSIDDPGRVGAVLVTSHHDTLRADAMLDEFDIERLDAYFDRTRAARQQPGNLLK